MDLAGIMRHGLPLAVIDVAVIVCGRHGIGPLVTEWFVNDET